MFNNLLPSFPVLLTAARVKTLVAAVCPVLIGASLANRFDYLFWLALITASLIQIATNYANDLYDFKKGADTKDRLGPRRVLASGLASEAQMKNALIATLALSVVLGFFIVINSHWIILLIGLLSLTLALAYTTGPFPLSYLGIADLFVVIFFGPVATAGTYFVLKGYISDQSILLGFCVGLISTAILVVNNTRDIEEDIKTGKRTLQARFGRNFANFEYSLLLLLPLLALKSTGFYIYLISVFLLIFLFFRAKSGRDFNSLLGFTSLVLILFTTLVVLANG